MRHLWSLTLSHFGILCGNEICCKEIYQSLKSLLSFLTCVSTASQEPQKNFCFFFSLSVQMAAENFRENQIFRIINAAKKRRHIKKRSFDQITHTLKLYKLSSFSFQTCIAFVWWNNSRSESQCATNFLSEWFGWKQLCSANITANWVCVYDSKATQQLRN